MCVESNISKIVLPSEEQIIATAKKYIANMVRLTDKEAVQFIEICKAYSLDPFKREVYVVAYGDGQNRSFSIVTGYEVYIKRADRSGKLDGWNIEITEDGKKAICKIYRKDWKYPFVHTVYLEEAIQKKKDGSINSMWLKMPKFMLRKVAIGQAFRLAFPDELGGMPYLSEEISDKRSEELQCPKDIPDAEVVDDKTGEVTNMDDETGKDSKAIDNLQSYQKNNTAQIAGIVDEILNISKIKKVSVMKITENKPLEHFGVERLNNLLKKLKNGDYNLPEYLEDPPKPGDSEDIEDVGLDKRTGSYYEDLPF